MNKKHYSLNESGIASCFTIRETLLRRDGSFKKGSMNQAVISLIKRDSIEDNKLLL